MNGISGPTYDETTFKINSAGAVQWVYTLDPSVVTTNKNETTKIICRKTGTTVGFCTFGMRAIPANPGLTDIYMAGYATFSPPDLYSCDNTISTPYSSSNVALTTATITTADYSTLISGALLQSVSTLNNLVRYCFEDYLVGGRLQAVGTGDEGAVENLASARVFPNPSNGVITLVRAGDEPAQVVVMDVMGRVVAEVQQTTGTSVSFDLSEEPAGVYLVRVTSASGTETVRVIRE